MKLLFDENLSHKLPLMLAADFPGSMHVRACDLVGREDEELWEYARANDLTIISKDSDFQQRSLLFGHPPKVIWLRIGNCTRDVLMKLIMARQAEIRAFCVDPLASVLVIS